MDISKLINYWGLCIYHKLKYWDLMFTWGTWLFTVKSVYHRMWTFLTKDGHTSCFAEESCLAPTPSTFLIKSVPSHQLQWSMIFHALDIITASRDKWYTLLRSRWLGFLGDMLRKMFDSKTTSSYSLFCFKVKLPFVPVWSSVLSNCILVQSQWNNNSYNKWPCKQG